MESQEEPDIVELMILLAINSQKMRASQINEDVQAVTRHGLSKSTIFRYLRGLKEKGYLSEEAGERKNISSSYFLTPDGKAVCLGAAYELEEFSKSAIRALEREWLFDGERGESQAGEGAEENDEG